MSGGFSFQVNDGVNFTPRQIFSITAQALVLSLERNRPLKVFPGEFLLSVTLWIRSDCLGSIEVEDCGELMEKNQSTCPQLLWVNVSELFQEVRTKMTCCHSRGSMGWVMSLALVWLRLGWTGWLRAENCQLARSVELSCRGVSGCSRQSEAALSQPRARRG